MKPAQVRAELLGEHFELRGLIEQTREVLRSDPTAEALGGSAERLASALLAHARHEEEALRVILEARPARASGSEAFMDELHVAEHARLVGVLRDASATLDEETRKERIGDVLDALEVHMAEEEETLLGEDLLLGASDVLPQRAPGFE